MKPLNKTSLRRATLALAAEHPIFGRVYQLHGAPPLWDREPGFATLLKIILEQQVSLASAQACYDKLEARLGHVTPGDVLTLDDAEMKRVGFSRQKMAYARHLAEDIIDRHIDLDRLHKLPDTEVKSQLMQLKGVGEWTSDIYLLMALLRPDVMPKGDIALHSAYHKLTGEPKPTSDEFIRIAEQWRPYRSVAARLLWHYYLSEKRGKSDAFRRSPQA
ncbi:MAG: DNA-3-methyladenine glycosylase family protein [Pyrinomonadaceae bacterium]